MKATYECGVCGVISEERDNLCHPQSLNGRHDSCSPSLESKTEICSTMEKSVILLCLLRSSRRRSALDLRSAATRLID